MTRHRASSRRSAGRTGRIAPAAAAMGALTFVAALVTGGFVSNVRAADPAPSDVVMEFDFSGSITTNKTTRTQLASALDVLADRVEATSSQLIQGDTTVTLIQFATHAAEVPACADLHLLGSQSTVTTFANCLHRVASEYSSGGTKALTKKIGIFTNYVEALELANTHLPPDSIRPAIIFFTDVKRDNGVPMHQALPKRDELFGSRTAIALLPVGMAVNATDQATLEAALGSFSLVKGIPDCTTGAALTWPTPVFTTPEAAGNAVEQALADATCTFTPAPTPTPTPPPMPPAPSDIRLTAGNGEIDFVWIPAPISKDVPVVGYAARCRAGDNAPWIESTNVPVGRKTTITGLENGTTYTCEVASVSASGPGAYIPADSTATPIGPPDAPAAPTVAGGAGELLVSVQSEGPNIDHYDVECSNDGGQTWTAKGAAAGDDPRTTIGDVENGTEYVCRAYAANSVGTSGASPVSDIARPCSGLFQCNPVVIPVVGGIGALLLLALVAAFLYVLRDRQSGHVVAVVDVVHTANIGHGSNLGIAFVQSPETKRVTGIVAERGKKADVHIRRLGRDRFEVRDKTGTRVVGNGDTVVVADSVGGRHSLELRAFSTNAASQVASRR